MKLLFENWRGYLEENTTSMPEPVERRILNAIEDGKSYEDIKDQFKFSDTTKERIVKNALEFYKTNTAAAYENSEQTYKAVFGGKDSARLGFMDVQGGGLKFIDNDEVAAVEDLTTSENKKKVFNIIKATHPNFMNFLAYLRLVVGAAGRKLNYIKLHKVSSSNNVNSEIEVSLK